MLGELIAQGERVLHAVSDCVTAVPLEALQLAGGRARDDGIGLLRLPAFERTDALEHEAAAPAGDRS